MHVDVLGIWLTSLSLELSKTLLADSRPRSHVQDTASIRCALRPPMTEKCPTSSPMSQADPSRHISDFPHGSSAKVKETTSPLIQELKGNADAGDTPSRGRRGGVAIKDDDFMNKGPEINVGSPEMGGSRNDEEELAQLLRDANAEEFVDTLLRHGLRGTRDLVNATPQDLLLIQIPPSVGLRMLRLAQAAPQEPPPPKSAIRRSQSVSEQAERDLAEQAERELASVECVRLWCASFIARQLGVAAPRRPPT